MNDLWLLVLVAKENVHDHRRVLIPNGYRAAAARLVKGGLLEYDPSSPHYVGITPNGNLLIGSFQIEIENRCVR